MSQEANGDISLRQIISSKMFLVFSSIIILIDLSFPPTFTWDSGHYFSYFKVLNGELPWSAWDPLRGLFFPLYLKSITVLLGKTSIALLIPMIFFHLVLFLIISWLAMSASQSVFKIKQNWLVFFVFIFIALDPLIVGFYHAVLTEFIASLLAILSCLCAYLLFKNVENKKILLILFFLFSILIIVAWHLKQPYFGTAFFPLMLASFLTLVKVHQKGLFLRIIAGNVLVVVVLLASIFAWDRAVPSNNDPAYQTRTISSWLDTAFSRNLDLLERSPKAFLRIYTYNYLTLANIYYWEADRFVNEGKFVIDTTFSLTRARENKTIAYRIYDYGTSNLLTVPQEFLSNVTFYEDRYEPPVYLNEFLKATTPKSNLLFSTLYLTLPFTFFIVFLLVIFKKDPKDCLIITFICSGSALLNALEHSFFNLPADRYLFWGYPLVLLCFLLFLLFLYDQISRILHRHAADAANPSV